jgi:hypothetical protein
MKEVFPSNLKVIVTGAPCSGTMNTARALFKEGVNAWHETFLYEIETGTWFAAPAERTLKENGGTLKEVEVDVNYALAKALEHLPKTFPAAVVHLVRNPLQVLNSYLSICLRHTDFVSIDAVARDLWDLNDLVCRSPRLCFRHRVEEGVEVLLEKLVSRTEVSRFEHSRTLVPEEAPRNFHNQGRCNFSWEDLRNYEWPEKLREQYVEYGYQ